MLVLSDLRALRAILAVTTVFRFGGIVVGGCGVVFLVGLVRSGLICLGFDGCGRGGAGRGACLDVSEYFVASLAVC